MLASKMAGCPALGRIAVRSAGYKARTFSYTPSRLSQAAAVMAHAEPQMPPPTGSPPHLSWTASRPPTATAKPVPQTPPVEVPPSSSQRDEFWRQIPMWENVSADEFISWKWTTKNLVEHHTRSKDDKLQGVLTSVLPEFVPCKESPDGMQSRADLIDDIFQGIRASSMSLRIMPHIFSRINWQDPRNDPIFRQFLPLKSRLLPDHPKSALDSLHEDADSPVDGLTHRYPDRVLFLALSVCPTYCLYCTRSYSVGAPTEEVAKQQKKPMLKRWEAMFKYVESHPQIADVVLSGGDMCYVPPDQLAYIGQRLIDIPHVRKFRFASKALAVCPNLFLDPADRWADALIWVSKKAKAAGKRVALHTHFNHPNEISWVTEAAVRRLVDAGVTVRNQTVLLRGVNDDAQTMSTLIRRLAEDLRIEPYYVYQCDLVPKVEHLRTPLQTILDLETQIRGSIAGFDMPQFIVDLPEGGGKRLACSFLEYDRETGVSKFVAPAVTGHGDRDKKDAVYEYYDPVRA